MEKVSKPSRMPSPGAAAGTSGATEAACKKVLRSISNLVSQTVGQAFVPAHWLSFSLTEWTGRNACPTSSSPAKQLQRGEETDDQPARKNRQICSQVS